MTLIPRGTSVKWNDRCVSTGIQTVAVFPSTFKGKIAVGTISITTMGHILGIHGTFVAVAPTEKELGTNNQVFQRC